MNKSTIYLENTVYDELRNFVKRHHGFGASAFEEEPNIKIVYDSFMNKLKALDGQKVRIAYVGTSDWLTKKGEKFGTIRVKDDKVRFYEGRRRARYYFLDAGLFDGWYAVLIPLLVEAPPQGGDNEPFENR